MPTKTTKTNPAAAADAAGRLTEAFLALAHSVDALVSVMDYLEGCLGELLAEDAWAAFEPRGSGRLRFPLTSRTRARSRNITAP
jgi:hypothetical protein